jgi:hypothetical protein
MREGKRIQCPRGSRAQENVFGNLQPAPPAFLRQLNQILWPSWPTDGFAGEFENLFSGQRFQSHYDTNFAPAGTGKLTLAGRGISFMASHCQYCCVQIN